jgi:hypothetical protein
MFPRDANSDQTLHIGEVATGYQAIREGTL